MGSSQPTVSADDIAGLLRWFRRLPRGAQIALAAACGMAIIIIITAVAILPRIQAPAEDPACSVDAGAPPVAALACLPVRAPGTMNGYSRDRFGQPWTDTITGVEFAGNGCDTRNDMLAARMTGVRRDADGCTMLSGTLADPYTGKTIRFTRGKNTSAAVQIDHIVALADAWRSGAAERPLDELKRIANDPLNLEPVEGRANSSKSDSAADSWLPPSAAYHCTYATRQVQVKNKYRLSVTDAEADALRRILSRC